MKTKHALALGGLAILSSLTALAQDPDRSWSRSYPVTGKPTLTLETADAGVEFRPCGDCHEIRIHIEVVGRKMSDYRLEEGQSGDEVHFHAVALHTSDGTLDLNLREGTKLAGASTIQSSDGSVTIRVPPSFAADLSVHTSDGHVDCALPLAMDNYQSGGRHGNELHGKLNGGGTPLTINTSDGNLKIEQL
jgi:Putative adhesin